MANTKHYTSKNIGGNERVDNNETSDTLSDEIVIKTTKEEEALIKWLKSMNLKHHVIKSVIDIITLCEKNDRVGKK